MSSSCPPTLSRTFFRLSNPASLHGLKLSTLPTSGNSEPRLEIQTLGLEVTTGDYTDDPGAQMDRLSLVLDPLALTSLHLVGAYQLQPDLLDCLLDSVPNLRDLESKSFLPSTTIRTTSRTRK